MGGWSRLWAQKDPQSTSAESVLVSDPCPLIETRNRSSDDDFSVVEKLEPDTSPDAQFLKFEAQFLEFEPQFLEFEPQFPEFEAQFSEFEAQFLEFAPQFLEFAAQFSEFEPQFSEFEPQFSELAPQFLEFEAHAHAHANAYPTPPKCTALGNTGTAARWRLSVST